MLLLLVHGYRIPKWPRQRMMLAITLSMLGDVALSNTMSVVFLLRGRGRCIQPPPAPNQPLSPTLQTTTPQAADSGRQLEELQRHVSAAGTRPLFGLAGDVHQRVCEGV